MHTYAAEEWTDEEAEILRRYFTNLDQPVFALVNLPEIVKGALFARYLVAARPCAGCSRRVRGRSRHHRRPQRRRDVGLVRAEQLYDRVFFEYGDDSVAQLGGVHLACEQASNVLTKILEWGRLMAYLEQSTRYIAYDVKEQRPLPVLPIRLAARAWVRRHGPDVRHLRRPALRPAG